MVVRLLEKDSSKAFVDVQDSYGDTALHIASRQGHKDVVKELLNRKASKDILNLVRPCVFCEGVGCSLVMRALLKSTLSDEITFW